MKDTDTHHLDTVSNLSSPSHLKKNIPSNISEVRTRSTTKKLRHCLENHKGYHSRYGDDKECSCCSLSRGEWSVSGMCLFYVNNSQYTI